MLKLRGGWAVAFFGGLTVLFLAVLIVGASRGELCLPSRGFAVRVQHATNPSGFYLTAMVYAALAGLSGYPLWLLLRSGGSAPLPPTPWRAARGALDLRGRVSVQSAGRSGAVHVALDGGSHDFWWEFGGGDCVAMITVPSADEWTQLPALAAYARDAYLDALAREVGRLQCPSARYEIVPRAILFKNS